MATDVVTLWNQAVSLAGGRGLISAEDESSTQADLCRLWYTTIRDNVLKAASWPSTKSWVSLALLATRDENVDWTAADPAPTWKYAYAAPTNMIAPHHLSTYARFERGLYDGQLAIFTNQPSAILHYLLKQSDVTKWDTGLESAVIHSLAATLAIPLSGKRTNAEYLASLAREQVLIAATDIANESDFLQDELPSWIEERGYEGLPTPTRYIYPYEQLNAVRS